MDKPKGENFTSVIILFSCWHFIRNHSCFFLLEERQIYLLLKIRYTLITDSSEDKNK